VTGDHRGYDRRLGRYDRPKVLQNFFLVRGDDCDTAWSLGAVELMYRYSYVDLQDATVEGGRLGEHTLGVNWYLNPNTKIQANYLISSRYVPGPANSGTIHGLGVRMHIDY